MRIGIGLLWVMEKRTVIGNSCYQDENSISCFKTAPRLTPWSGVLLENVTGPQLFKKLPALRNSEASLPHSQAVPILRQINPIHASPSHHLILFFHLQRYGYYLKKQNKNRTLNQTQMGVTHILIVT
jgi:hypothetical protein